MAVIIGVPWMFMAANAMSIERAAADTTRPALTLAIVTDRAQYRADDTVMVLAKFAGHPLAKLQFDDAGGGAVYFHLLVRPLDKQGRPFCNPLWRLQFVEWAEVGNESATWLTGVGTGATRQLALHLPRLSGLPAGRYDLRVGYGLDTRKLQRVVTATAGDDFTVDGLKTTKLKGASEDAVLSAPVTIAIRPAGDKR